MEFRQEMSEFVRKYAVNQFQKCFGTGTPLSKTEPNILKNVNIVNEIYGPRRYYRRKNAPPADIQTQVQITLLEYGNATHTKETINTQTHVRQDNL